MTSSRNTSHNITPEEIQQYLAHLQHQSTMAFIPALIYLCLLIALGTIGNTLVLVLYSTKFTKKPLRYFIITMATTDLFTCCIVIPGEIYDMFHIWDFDNPIVCKIRLYLNSSFVLSSVVVLVVIAITRYQIICNPFKKQISIDQTKLLCVASLIFAFVISIPIAVMLGSHTIKTPNPLIVGRYCQVDDSYVNTIWPILNSALFILLFIVSAFIIIIIYSRIARTTRRKWRKEDSLRITNPGCLTNSCQDSNNPGCLTQSSQDSNNPGCLTHSCQDSNNPGCLTQSCQDSNNPGCQEPNVAKSYCRTNLDVENIYTCTQSEVSSNLNLFESSFTRQASMKEPIYCTHFSTNDNDPEIKPTQIQPIQVVVKEVSSLKPHGVKGVNYFPAQSKAQSSTITRSNAHTNQLNRHKRPMGKTTLMMFIVTLVFFIGFLPFISLNVFLSVAPEKVVALEGFGLAMYQLFFNFYLLNSAANPIVYSFVDQKFRKECSELLKCYTNIKRPFKYPI
ncbi:hypothetical protein Btru_051634 [Bulinus truncatus]|nr:hypothetical protein Btru_051634 [Bulinus truncatus]